MKNYRVFKSLREALLGTTAWTQIQYRPAQRPQTNTTGRA